MQNLRTIGGLLEVLTDLRDAYGPECEIAVALQPSWPLAARIASLTHARDIADEGDEATPDDRQPHLIWIAVEEEDVCGSPYAPRAAWEEAESW